MLDLGSFVALLAVFVVSFGVAMQSLKHPAERITAGDLTLAVKIPFWNMFGEELDDPEVESIPFETSIFECK